MTLQCNFFLCYAIVFLFITVKKRKHKQLWEILNSVIKNERSQNLLRSIFNLGSEIMGYINYTFSFIRKSFFSWASIFLTLTEGGTNIGDGDFLNIFFILFRMSPYGFSPITSTNMIISLQNFLTFTFDPFATLVWNFKAIPSTSPKLLSLNQDHPSKKVFFLVKSL